MSDKTGIEWTDSTWNPLRGCSRVSDGCRNCYAESQAARIQSMDRGRGVPEGEGSYDGLLAKGGQWNGEIKVVHQVLDQPLRWRKPRLIFVNSMSDLFHEAVTVETLDRIFAVMLACAAFNNRQHTFQVLTKRAERMRSYLASRTPAEHLKAWAEAGDRWIHVDDGDVIFSEYICGLTCHDWAEDGTNRADSPYMPWAYTKTLFPLPNLWLGVSVENQATTDQRVQDLMSTPATVRWISAEPLLGPVDLSSWLEIGSLKSDLGLSNPGIDWVVVGGESGPKARPMHPSWARPLRDQCAAAGVPFLFKQWGEHLPWTQFGDAKIVDDPEQTRFQTSEFTDGTWNDVGRPTWSDSADGHIDDEQCAGRVGKRAAGRLLDGKLHEGYPRTALRSADPVALKGKQTA